MPTKAQLEEKNAALLAAKRELERQISEAKRQQTHIPVVIGNSADDGGSYAIDHLTLMDNHEAPDTNKELREDIQARDSADLSFWNNSWTWVHTEKSYGDKPEDSWFINPTSKLIGEVMLNAPTIFGACEVALIAGEHTEQMEKERVRHTEFLQTAEQGDLVSEALDLMTAYQSRYFEAVQRYIGQVASYDNQASNSNIDEERLEATEMRKHDAGTQCRGWVARLIALREAYHAVVTDERAYNLSFDFAPMPPAQGQAPSRAYGLFRWAVTNTLNKVGRRLTRSIKEGKMDAEKYRIPRPWITEDRLGKQLEAGKMISDFN